MLVRHSNQLLTPIPRRTVMIPEPQLQHLPRADTPCHATSPPRLSTRTCPKVYPTALPSMPPQQPSPVRAETSMSVTLGSWTTSVSDSAIPSCTRDQSRANASSSCSRLQARKLQRRELPAYGRSRLVLPKNGISFALPKWRVLSKATSRWLTLSMRTRARLTKRN
ncbi:hypothetical protein BDV93DRAFT_349244 [Ceratobasidium sp. AG-I]|nr:hypothetical protein BDV93DRAFT_349244 [Ceratobasidium sp. AG-I]